MSLTDIQIRQSKPKDKSYKLSDGKGLFLLVTPTGARYWRLKYRIAGKEKLLSFGVYPSISLKKARKACTDAKDLLEQGIDPSQAKKAKKVEQLQALTNNLEAIAREWQKQQALKWSVGYSDKVLRSL
ncbi:Arm DNA-binding domain-containing protein [Candidatus Njordibacter sp. Uisw_039]|uniref:tyrosine-type recombinase/integrase n=1 Tax=Candidatus Njordibacter sp. Uisw_039 TaxID=3230972 RepID=UPI003D578944